jgi:uncharacterized protein (TIGR03066 family)
MSKSRLKHPTNEQGRTLSATAPRRNRGPRTADAHPNPAPAGIASRWKWLLLGLAALLAFAGTWWVCERFVWARVPSELVGKWVVTEGPQEGATFDFYRGGTMVGTVNAGGKEATIDARVRVEGKMIYSTTTNPHTGRDETRVLTIRTLTARQLVVEDQQGQVLKMERAE